MGVLAAHFLTHSPTLPLRGKVPLRTGDFPMSGDLGSPQEERHWPPVPKALSGSHWTMCFSVKASRTTEAMQQCRAIILPNREKVPETRVFTNQLPPSQAATPGWLRNSLAGETQGRSQVGVRAQNWHYVSCTGHYWQWVALRRQCLVEGWACPHY